MREMISEASRTIEDSGTAQALHGLLSLKSLESSTSSNEFPNLLRAVSGQSQKGGDGFALTTFELDSASEFSNSQSNQSTETLSNRLSSQVFLQDVQTATSRTGAKSANNLSLVVRVPTDQDQPQFAQKTKPIKPKIAPNLVQQTPLSSTAAVALGMGREHLSTSGGDQLTSTGIRLPLISTKSPTAVSEGQYHVVLMASPSGANVARSPTTSAGPPADVSQGVPIQLIATSQGVLAIPQNFQLQQLTKQPFDGTVAQVQSQPLMSKQSVTPIFIAPSSAKQNQPSWPLSIVSSSAVSAVEPTVKRKISLAAGEQNRNGVRPAKVTRSVLSVVTNSTKSGNFVSDQKNLSQQTVVSGPTANVCGTGTVGLNAGKKETMTPMIVDIKGSQVSSKHLVSVLPRLAAAPMVVASNQSQMNTLALSSQLLSNNILIRQSADTSSSVDLLALAAESSGCHSSSSADFMESVPALKDVVETKEVRLTTQIYEGFGKSFSRLQMYSQSKLENDGQRDVRHLSS